MAKNGRTATTIEAADAADFHPAEGLPDDNDTWLSYLLAADDPPSPPDDPPDDPPPAPYDEPGAAEAYEVRDEIVLEKSVGGATFRLHGFDDGAALEPPSWLIHGLLPARGVTMLFAPPSIGKTWVADDWAVRIASGTPWLGRPVMSGSVLYIAAEGAFTLPLRTFAAKDNLGIHRNLPIFTLTRPLMFGADGTHVEILADMVKDHFRRRHWPPAVLVVVDTYTVSLEGSANDDDVASAFMRGLRRFLGRLAPPGAPAPAGLVLHHPGLDDASRGRGSSAFTGDVDCGFMLEALVPVGGTAPPQPDPAAPPPPPAARTLVLHCAKPPRQGPEPPDVPLVLQPVVLTDETGLPLDLAGEVLTALVVQPAPGEVHRKSKKDEAAEKRKTQELRALAALKGSPPLQSEEWRKKSEVSSTQSWEKVRDHLMEVGKVVQIEPLPGKSRYRYALSSADHPKNPQD